MLLFFPLEGIIKDPLLFDVTRSYLEASRKSLAHRMPAAWGERPTSMSGVPAQCQKEFHKGNLTQDYQISSDFFASGIIQVIKRND